MPSWEPVPGYTALCQHFRDAQNSSDCSWNMITTVWETRGIKAFGGGGVNNMIIRVEHSGIREESKNFEKEINSFPNRVYKRQFSGQPYEFFASSIIVSCWHKKLIGTQLVGQVQIGVMDIFLSDDHMIPMQWYPLVDPSADLPSEPLGFIKLNVIINTLDEPGAVQRKAPDEVADWEIAQKKILQIPRLNMRKVACHQYNLKISVYQGFDLGDGTAITADPVFRVATPCGVVNTDPYPNSLKPTWNCMLQLPYYEPTFCDLVYCQVWDGSSKMISKLLFSWKDLYINLEQYQEPRWVDMYERKYDPMKADLPLLEQSGAALLEQAGVPRLGPGGFEEPSIYCGRVLLSFDIEERSLAKEPSPATIALKPKDCASMWADPMQKMFFRFHCFFGQEFKTDVMKGSVQVEFSVGRKKVTCKPVDLGDKGVYEIFEAVEMEMDLPFDDEMDNPKGSGKPSEGNGWWHPQTFIERLPDVIVKVYKVSPLNVVGNFIRSQAAFIDIGDRELLGIWRGSAISVLGGGDQEMWMDNVYVGNDKMDNQTAPAGKPGMLEGIQSIVIAPGDEAPLPSKQVPWGKPEKELSQHILNPYTGYQYVAFKSDSMCSVGPDDPAGFIGFSCKLWMPTREKCANGPPKGPPVLSPWKAWNILKIPPPWSDFLKWVRVFSLRAHIYQAKGLPAKNGSGVANALAELKFLKYPTVRSHTVYMTNNPTFDKTLILSDIELWLIPQDRHLGADEYYVDAEDYTEVEDNKNMLKLAPAFEVQIHEETEGGGTLLLGRSFVHPADVFTRKVNPTFIELFRGNPEIEEGHLLVSFQVIESTEKLMKEPLTPLMPDRCMVKPDDKDTWTSPAPVKTVPMMDCKIQIQVLGLRDLTSPYPMGMPISAPQVEVCCDDPKTACNTKTSSRPSGTNANFMECLEIDVRLPEDKVFAPLLDFYVYDHTTLGFLPEIPLDKPPIVAYGSMETSQFYPSDDELDEDEDEDEGELDEEALERRRQMERKKKFAKMVTDLKSGGDISGKEAQKLEKLFVKRDEAVTRAFEQYVDAPDPEKFIERVEEFILAGGAAEEKAKKAKEEAKKKEGAEAKKKKKEDAKEKDKAADTPAVENGGDIAAPPGGEDNGDGGDAGPGGTPSSPSKSSKKHGHHHHHHHHHHHGESKHGESKAESSMGTSFSGSFSKADAPDMDAMEAGDEQMSDEDGEVGDADGIYGLDDALPDRKEFVDTPDGKPNAEWIMLRAHKLYDCPLELSTVRDYGETGAWQPRFEDAFDEVPLYRGTIKNFKLLAAEEVGLLKCKVKLFKLEDAADAEARGDEQRYLDMAEMKRGKEVPYTVPDVNENFPQQNLEVRIYLLKAFQVTPSQIVDGIAQSNNWVRVQLGTEEWDWRRYYDCVTSLNPHFYRCGKITAKLPGASRCHVQLMHEQDWGAANLVKDAMGGLGDQLTSTVIGETIIDLEDRWFCEEWSRKTINKPRETRELIDPKNPGISVGKFLMIVDAVLKVEADDHPERDVNIAGRQMPLELRIIVWNLRSISPKDGYTSNVKVTTEMMGWGRVKETDSDFGVKTSRLAMFNYRIKFKGIKFPSPDPTIPAKDYLLRVAVWHAAFGIPAPDISIAEGILPLQPLFQECMQRNLGKTSADDMEIVDLEPEKAGDKLADEEGTKYPFRWFKLCHPGGPGCKVHKDFRQPGYDFEKNYQAEIQMTIQVMPRAKARALPASLGFKAGPAKLIDPNRPPQPTNPIFNPEGCKQYIIYTCKEAINGCKPCCCCICCILIVVIVIVGYFYLNQIGIVPKLPMGR